MHLIIQLIRKKFSTYILHPKTVTLAFPTEGDRHKRSVNAVEAKHSDTKS